jgi:hypothetical protein
MIATDVVRRPSNARTDYLPHTSRQDRAVSATGRHPVYLGRRKKADDALAFFDQLLEALAANGIRGKQLRQPLQSAGLDGRKWRVAASEMQGS